VSEIWRCLDRHFHRVQIAHLPPERGNPIFQAIRSKLHDLFILLPGRGI